MDTVVFVKTHNWTGTYSHTLEMPVDRLAAACVNDWSTLDDVRFAGYVLPERLQDRYFGLLERDDDPPQAAWDAFMDDLWDAVRAMGLEEQADWFIELHDPVTIRTHYWMHDGIEYWDAAHTLPWDE